MTNPSKEADELLDGPIGKDPKYNWGGALLVPRELLRELVEENKRIWAKLEAAEKVIDLAEQFMAAIENSSSNIGIDEANLLEALSQYRSMQDDISS